MVEKFSRALLNQEIRMGYVTQEVNLIFQILEESDRYFVVPQSPSSAPTRDRTTSFSLTNDMTNSNSTGTPSHSEGEVQANKRLTLCEFVLQQSSLANELRGLYHSLVGEIFRYTCLICMIGGYCVSLTVNGVLSLNIPLIPQCEIMSSSSVLSGKEENIDSDNDFGSKRSGGIPKQKTTSESIPEIPSIDVTTKKFYERNPKRLFPFHSFLAVADAEELSDIMNKLGCPLKMGNDTPSSTFLPEKTSAPSVSISNSLKHRALAAGCMNTPDRCETPTSSQSSSATASNVGLAGPVSSHQCSPLVHRILTGINPTTSFAELRNSLDCSMEEVRLINSIH